MRRLLLAVAVVAAVAGTSAQTPTFTQVGAIAGTADLIEVSGSRLYVAGGKTLTILDVADPATPRRLGTYTFSDLIWNMTVAGSTLYLAVDTSGLAILDTSNPDKPVLRAALKTPGQAKAVALSGTRAFVADHVRGIDVIDLSSPAKPTLTTSLFVDGFAKDVATRGTWLYALDQPNGLNVFDLSARTLASPTGTLTLTNPIPLRSQMDVSESTSPRLAIVAGGGPLQVHDVSDPKAPKHVTTYRTPGNPQRISIQGSRVYVADGPAGLQVIDLTTPAAPSSAGGVKLAGFARDVAVAGPLVFVVVGTEEVVILRQNP